MKLHEHKREFGFRLRLLTGLAGFGGICGLVAGVAYFWHLSGGALADLDVVTAMRWTFRICNQNQENLNDLLAFSVAGASIFALPALFFMLYRKKSSLENLKKGA